MELHDISCRKKRAATSIRQLMAQAKVITKTFSLLALLSEVGLTKVIEEMNSKFECDHVLLLFNNASSFLFLCEKKKCQLRSWWLDSIVGSK